MSRFAITFQLDLSRHYYSIYYKYILYNVRIVTQQDLMPKANKILLEPPPEDINVS